MVQAKRLATFITGLVECLCFAGILFGFASIVFVFKSEGYFKELCVNGTANETDAERCSAQDEQFSLIFTISSFMNNFMTLPAGYIFDRYGTTVARLLAISLYTLATVMIAFSSAATAMILFPALSFLAVGGILFLLTNIQVGNLFGNHRSTIITLYNGAFDSSSAILLIVKVLYESGVPLQASFLFISCCSVIHVLRTFFLMPRKQFPYPLPDDYNYGLPCGKRKELSITKDNVNDKTQPTPSSSMDKEVHTENTPLQNDRKTAAASPQDQRDFKSCFFSSLFFWHLVWISVMQLRHYLFIGTLNPMLVRLSENDQHQVSRYTNAFAFTQLCGVLCAPWNGLVIDRHKRGHSGQKSTDALADLQSLVLSLALTAFQCILFSLCVTIPVLPVQYASFILQVLNRSFLYGGNAAFIAIAFPAHHFGKLYGLIMALSAVVSLLQYPCFALMKGPLNGDPLYVNIVLLGMTLLAFVNPINVYLHCRRQNQNASQTNEGNAPCQAFEADV
ncbi:S43A3 protein, partial [Polypterus senegalus]